MRSIEIIENFINDPDLSYLATETDQGVMNWSSVALSSPYTSSTPPPTVDLESESITGAPSLVSFRVLSIKTVTFRSPDRPFELAADTTTTGAESLLCDCVKFLETTTPQSELFCSQKEKQIDYVNLIPTNF